MIHIRCFTIKFTFVDCLIPFCLFQCLACLLLVTAGQTEGEEESQEEEGGQGVRGCQVHGLC